MKIFGRPLFVLTKRVENALAKAIALPFRLCPIRRPAMREVAPRQCQGTTNQSDYHDAQKKCDLTALRPVLHYLELPANVSGANRNERGSFILDVAEVQTEIENPRRESS